MRIGIDIDGVINNVDQLKLDYLYQFCVTRDKKIKNANGFLISRMTDLTPKEIEEFQEYYRPLLLRNAKARPFAAEIIDKLMFEGHQIILFTSEKGYGRDHTPIYQWLIKNDIHYHEISFTRRKQYACQDYKIDLMIDDNYTLFRKLPSNICCFCYETRYNRFYFQRNVIHVHSWYDIYDKIIHWDQTILDYERRKFRAKIRD